MIRASVAEVRRFFVALLWGTRHVLVAHVSGWSNRRRHHQALAKFFHYKARMPLPIYPCDTKLALFACDADINRRA